MQPQRCIKNQLLAHLCREDYALIGEHLEPWHGKQGQVYIKEGDYVPFILFPESGVTSIIVRTADGSFAEASLVGREGFIHPALIMGSDRLSWDAQVQIVGTGYCVARQHFLYAMERSRELSRIMLLFAHTLLVQSSTTALCNAIYRTEQRLARWLLMCHDRSDGDELLLTHDFMSTMLAVRRPSTTNAIHILEGERLIWAERSRVTVRDRAGLESFAGAAYGQPEAEYRRVLEPLLKVVA